MLNRLLTNLLFTVVFIPSVRATSLDSLKRDSTILLSEVLIVTAQRMEMKAGASSDAVVLLNRDQLIRQSAMSTPDAMSSMAGVWMQKTNHGGGSPFIRGLTGYHTLLLTDGIRF